MSMQLPLRNERGIALVAALVIMALLIVLGTIALNSTVNELRVTGNDKSNRLAFYAAESGVEFARAQIRDAFVNASNQAVFVAGFAGSPPSFTPPTGYAFTIAPVAVTPVGSGTVADPYRFRIRSSGAAAGNAAAAIDAEFNLVVINNPLQYAAYGNDFVTLHNGSFVVAYDSATGNAEPGEADVFSEGAVTLKAGATVDGTVTSNGTGVSDDPLGLLTPGGGLDSDFTAATTTNDNATPALSPYLSGTDLTVSVATTISLPPGDYYFTSITLNKAVTIEIDTSGGAGEVNIYLDGPLTAKKDVNINIAGVPTDFSIYSRSDDPINFNNAANINGLIYAPAADITVKHAANINGAVYGDSIDFKSSSWLNYDVQMRNKFPPGGGTLPLPIVSWREI